MVHDILLVSLNLVTLSDCQWQHVFYGEVPDPPAVLALLEYPVARRMSTPELFPSEALH